jgi:hypothetical protein
MIKNKILIVASLLFFLYACSKKDKEIEVGYFKNFDFKECKGSLKLDTSLRKKQNKIVSTPYYSLFKIDSNRFSLNVYYDFKDEIYATNIHFKHYQVSTNGQSFVYKIIEKHDGNVKVMPVINIIHYTDSSEITCTQMHVSPPIPGFQLETALVNYEFNGTLKGKSIKGVFQISVKDTSNFIPKLLKMGTSNDFFK